MKGHFPLRKRSFVGRSGGLTTRFFIAALIIGRVALLAAKVSPSHNNEIEYGDSSEDSTGYFSEKTASAKGSGVKSSDDASQWHHLIGSGGRSDGAIDLGTTRSLYDKLLRQEEDVGKHRGTAEYQAMLEKQIIATERLIYAYGADHLLRLLEYHDPQCHNEAHQVGRAAVRITDDFVTLLKMCDAGCQKGCFHGVIMGLLLDNSDGDPEDMPAKDRQAHISRLLRDTCDEATLGDSRKLAPCLHGVGHAAVVASESHGLEEAMEICVAAFIFDWKKQHQCGTGVAMQLKRVIDVDPFTLCANISLPASCFEYAWARVPKAVRLADGEEDDTPTIVFGWTESGKCVKLATPELKEACMYGLGSIIARSLTEQEKDEPKMVRMKSRMTSTVKRICLVIKEEEGRTACTLGMLRYARKWFKPEALQVVCAASENLSMITDCMEKMKHGNDFVERFFVQASRNIA